VLYRALAQQAVADARVNLKLFAELRQLGASQQHTPQGREHQPQQKA
jgi:hypothetical protein